MKKTLVTVVFEVDGHRYWGQYFYLRFVVGSYNVLYLIYNNFNNVCK